MCREVDANGVNPFADRRPQSRVHTPGMWVTAPMPFDGEPDNSAEFNGKDNDKHRDWLVPAMRQ